MEEKTGLKRVSKRVRTFSVADNEARKAEILSKSKAGKRRGPAKKHQDLSEEALKALKREKNRNCAKQCRARKKFRYSYLEDVNYDTEKKVKSLRKEMKYLKILAKELDNNVISSALVNYRKNCGAMMNNEVKLEDLQDEKDSLNTPLNNNNVLSVSQSVIDEHLVEIDPPDVVCTEVKNPPDVYVDINFVDSSSKNNFFTYGTGWPYLELNNNSVGTLLFNGLSRTEGSHDGFKILQCVIHTEN